MRLCFWPKANDQNLQATRMIPTFGDSAGDDEIDSLLDEIAKSLTDTEENSPESIRETCQNRQLEVP